MTPSGQSNSQYLTVDLPGSNVGTDAAEVVFQPDIKQAGNYTVTMYTPGCLQDDSCDTRGIVNVTGSYATSTHARVPSQTQIYQSNNYDKYDQIYSGPVDASSGSFRPSVTLRPASGQSDIKLVAQRVRFQPLKNSTNSSDSALNGLFEFDPREGNIDTDFSNSTIDQAGMHLDEGAEITSLAVVGSTTFAGGNFSEKDGAFENIFSIGSGNATSLPNGGLDAEVSSLLSYEDVLYVGGNFTNTLNGSVTGLNNVAMFNTSSNAWQPLGSGVNGRVNTLVPLMFNVTPNQPETVITVNGDFTEILAIGENKSIPVPGFGIWVQSRQNWVQNIPLMTMAITGQLNAVANISGSAPLLAGTLAAQDMNTRDVVGLTTDPLLLNPFSFNIQQPAGSNPPAKNRTPKRKIKRSIGTDSNGQNLTGVVAGLFYNSGPHNITILGGQFTATGSNGSTIDNLAFLNSTGTVTGITAGVDPDSVFLDLATQGSLLYAGGSVSGQVDGANVSGLLVYDLDKGDFASPQPPALGGTNVTVNAITVRPKDNQIYVGGNFDTAGALGCPSVCMFENQQWSQPGSGLSGSVAVMMWQGNNKLLIGGNLTVNNNATTLANYDTQKQKWSPVDGAAANIPGPVTALTSANDGASEFWVAGKDLNQSTFLVKHDGSKYNSVDAELIGPQSIIRGLSMLSLNSKHASNDLVPSNMVLLVTGQLNLPTFGNASAALFNGTTFSPFILATSNDEPGSLAQLFSEKGISFSNPSMNPRTRNSIN